MLDITPDKIAHVILRARAMDEARATGLRAGGTRTGLHDFIADLNEDEQASLTAVMWIGRDSFSPDELEDAIAMARAERTVPTEDYLLGEPRLADFLEEGMEALGLSPEYEEDALTRSR